MLFGRPTFETCYLLCRLHALERHVDVLASMLKVNHPDESAQIDDLRAAWLETCEHLHAAFEAGDPAVFRAYAAQVTKRRTRMRRPPRGSG
jgi:hypothetical protein